MIVETIEELIETFRSEVDDAAGGGDDTDKLWKDVDILRYATEAADKVAKVTHTLHERISIAVTADVSYVALPARVVDILGRGRLTTLEQFVSQENDNEQDDFDAFFSSPGRPQRFVADYRANSLELYPTPSANDTLVLNCVVTISEAFDGSEDMPFTDPEDQRLMLLWMKKLAYAKQDAETYDLERSREFADEFKSLALERKGNLDRKRRRPGLVRMSGWS